MIDPSSLITELRQPRRRLITGRRLCIAACLATAGLAVAALYFGWL